MFLWIFLIVVGLPCLAAFLVERSENSPEALERRRQEEKEMCNQINTNIKRRLNRDFTTSIHINDTIAIDRTRDLVFISYKKNTMDYICVIPVTSIIRYSLEKEYESRNPAKRATVGALIGGSAGALVGAASATNSSFTGSYLLYVYFKINNTYADTYINCHSEDGQRIIRYLDSKLGN